VPVKTRLRKDMDLALDSGQRTASREETAKVLATHSIALLLVHNEEQRLGGHVAPHIF
jgi:hypothetical protein